MRKNAKPAPGLTVISASTQNELHVQVTQRASDLHAVRLCILLEQLVVPVQDQQHVLVTTPVCCVHELKDFMRKICHEPHAASHVKLVWDQIWIID